MPRRMQPLSGEGPLVQFARALRELQNRSGGSVAHAEAFGASRTAVYAALAGKRLPNDDTLLAINNAWGGAPGRWRELRRAAEAALAEESRLRGEVTVRITPAERKFHRALLTVWEAAGSPSRNEWGHAARLSPRTIAAYLEGRTLPTPPKFDQLILGLSKLCPRNEEDLGTWVIQEGATIREEDLHAARIARRAARKEGRLLAQALPGGQSEATDHGL